MLTDMEKGHKPNDPIASTASGGGGPLPVPGIAQEAHSHAPMENPGVSRPLDWPGGILGALLGAAAFLVILGYTPLIGANIGWLYGGDPTLYYLSAAFFQQSPWTFPPGLNPHFGLEVPSAIILADAIPLYGFFFKILYGITGHTVQYYGYWLFMCFMLQGLFGWLLAGQFTRSNTIKLSATLVVLFMPAFLARTLQLAHYPISGHFLILAALVMYFAPLNQHRRLLWTGLATLSTLCTTYICGMVLAVWLADVVARTYRSEQKKLYLGTEVALVLSAVLLTLWLSGLFVMSSGYVGEGFGLFRANLLSILDSAPGHLRWSYFLPPTPKVSPNHNAPNFMGSGLLLLVVASGLVCLEQRAKPFWKARVWPLIVVTVLMLFYALSNRVSIGSFEFVIPLSRGIEHLANLLRDSGRFMWPLTYLLVAGVVNVLSTRLDRRTACLLFLAAAAIQVVDTRAGWGGSSERIAARRAESWPTVLKSPFWERAGAVYRDVRSMPVVNNRPGWGDVAYFALKHGMRTNTVLLGRWDQVRVDVENERFVRDLSLGRLDSRTLYLLDDQYLETARKIAKPGDLLERIDGFLVLAPGWLTVSGCGDKTAPGSREGCIPTRMPGAALPLHGLKWRAWGPARVNMLRAEVSSDIPVDSALVSAIKLLPGSYLLTACMSWDVEGPPSGAAHLSIHGKKKLIEIQSSRAEGKCRMVWMDISQGSVETQISFGLGGWSTGKGRIRLERLTIQPLVETK